MQPQQDQSATPFAVPESVSNSTGAINNTSQSQINVPDIADDGDLIEKEWVAQVKQIVTATKHDPSLQNQQLSQLKVEYLQKRYGKQIKAAG